MDPQRRVNILTGQIEFLAMLSKTQLIASKLGLGQNLNPVEKSTLADTQEMLTALCYSVGALTPDKPENKIVT